MAGMTGVGLSFPKFCIGNPGGLRVFQSLFGVSLYYARRVIFNFYGFGTTPLKEPLEKVRLDRWLNAARFYKTRTQAAKACEGRKVKVNGQAAKPHKFIHVGDELTVHHRGKYRNLKILELAQRGLPPAVARTLYHEEVRQELSEDEKNLFALLRKAGKKFQPKFKGRPTKKERRQLNKMKDAF